MKTPKSFATLSQKENFKTKFAEIVANNEALNGKYSIQFFDTAAKSNYAFSNLNGKSINIMEHLSVEELEQYRVLKNHWQ
jgi:hypothetical protein